MPPQAYLLAAAELPRDQTDRVRVFAGVGDKFEVDRPYFPVRERGEGVCQRDADLIGRPVPRQQQRQLTTPRVVFSGADGRCCRRSALEKPFGGCRGTKIRAIPVPLTRPWPRAS